MIPFSSIKYGGILASICSQTGILCSFLPSSREAEIRFRSSSLATATSMVALNDAWEFALPGVFSGDWVGEKTHVPSGPSTR